jgi:hypothetical protein
MLRSTIHAGAARDADHRSGDVAGDITNDYEHSSVTEALDNTAATRRKLRLTLPVSNGFNVPG